MSKLFDRATFIDRHTGKRTPLTDMVDDCTPAEAAAYQEYIEMLAEQAMDDEDIAAQREAYEDSMYGLVLDGELGFDSTCPHEVAARRRHKARMAAQRNE